MVKNNNSLWDNLYKNACTSQEKLLNNILKPNREELKLLLENLYSSGYEISFKRKTNNQQMNKGTLRIRKIIKEENVHYGYINQHTLDENSLFAYCLGFKVDKCPDDFSNQIYGFCPDKGLYIIKIEGSEKGWCVVEGKRKSDKDKHYVFITSIELAHKIFNI